jgi:hypothetical protein
VIQTNLEVRGALINMTAWGHSIVRHWRN